MYSHSAQIVLLYEVKLTLMKDEKLSKKRKYQLRVCVNDEEKEQIESMVKIVDLGSASSYLRVLGLGYQPKSTLDHQAVLALAKVNADQGRLGGLLKMWLTNEERQDTEIHASVKKVILEIEEVQAELLKLVNKL
jgi:Trp operon repressor